MYYTDAFVRAHQLDRSARLRRLARRARPAEAAAHPPAANERPPPEPPEVVLDDAPGRERRPVGARR
jgi:hypothetical protein